MKVLYDSIGSNIGMQDSRDHEAEEEIHRGFLENRPTRFKYARQDFHDEIMTNTPVIVNFSSPVAYDQAIPVSTRIGHDCYADKPILTFLCLCCLSKRRKEQGNGGQ